MGRKDLHWEKIPGQSDEAVLKNQLGEVDRVLTQTLNIWVWFLQNI